MTRKWIQALEGDIVLFDDESSIRRLKVPCKCWIDSIDKLHAVIKQTLIRH